MRRFRVRFTLPALGVCLAAGLFVGLGAESAPASVKSAATTKVTIITVTAGKPSELAFKLSKFSAVPAGKITFKVTNQGVAFHTFEICSAPAASAAKNSCVGKATKLLKHGQSATLTVTLSKDGKYEFLCSVPGHAAAGMKGLIGIGVTAAAPVVAAPAKPTTTTTSPATTTTTTGGTTTTTGGGTTGADGCPAGKTIVTAGFGGDGDDDDTGGPSDGDGCL